MKLWLILMLHGSTVGVWGPLPYGMEECGRRAAEMVEEIDLKAVAKPETAFWHGVFTSKCLISDQRPQLEAAE